MTATLLSLTLALSICSDPPKNSETPRKPNPFAPSLPLLSEEEENDRDRIINRFIQADIGKLRGTDAKKAMAEFGSLGPDSIPALIRGVNRAAKIEASCPAVTIARQLQSLLRTSRDPELLDYARENIGAGVGETRHKAVLENLRVMCLMRKRYVAQNTAALQTAPGIHPLHSMTVSQLLSEAASSDQGPQRSAYLKELESRRTDEILPDTSAVAADDSNAKPQRLARDLLERRLGRLPLKAFKEKFKADEVEVRAAAARVAGKKFVHVEKELIDLLTDDSAYLRKTAHQALVRLNPRIDFGPKADDDATEREAAVQKWREWLAKQAKPGGR
jgi:hypothetical protein